MIRPATLADIPKVFRMAEELGRVTGIPVALDYPTTVARLAAIIEHGFAWVGDGAFLVGEVGSSPFGAEPIAIEHGWYCERPGQGLALLRRFEAWAAERGCARIRMTTGETGSARHLLARLGYRPVETAWVR